MDKRFLTRLHKELDQYATAMMQALEEIDTKYPKAKFNTNQIRQRLRRQYVHRVSYILVKLQNGDDESWRKHLSKSAR